MSDSKITGYLFDRGETPKRPYVIPGGELLVPDRTCDYYRVYSKDTNGELGELVYSIAGWRVDDVCGLTADEVDGFVQRGVAEDIKSQRTLSAALDHIEQLVGPTRAADCVYVSGGILESGQTKCMAHNHPGSKPGECAVAEAIAFVDAHRES